jgi:replication factor C subunit 2/4
MKYVSWVEKNRPNNLDEICFQEDIKIGLKNFIKNKNIPHLLFFGPSGTGKTSTIIALAKEIFGDEYFNRIKELNASDERGINVVREKIKNYSQESINNIEGLPPWKIIILDEADNMTSESQYALRRIMEEYSKITRFCVICNYHYKIIDPIVSRCALFRFKPIPKLFIKDQLKLISKKEKLKCSINIINKISDYSRGDLRKAINFLQRCYNCFGIEMNSSIIDEISGVVDDKILIAFINNCIKVNKTEVIDYINEFNNSGFSLVNQILSIHNIILNSKNFDSIEKSKLIILLGNIDQQLIKGCDEFIQLYKLAYYIMSLKSNLKT